MRCACSHAESQRVRGAKKCRRPSLIEDPLQPRINNRGGRIRWISHVAIDLGMAFEAAAFETVNLDGRPSLAQRNCERLAE